MTENYEETTKDLRNRISEAKKKFTELSSPTNKLSSDPIVQEQQKVDLENANLELKESTITYDLFLERVARKKAEENVNGLLPD